MGGKRIRRKAKNMFDRIAKGSGSDPQPPNLGGSGHPNKGLVQTQNKGRQHKAVSPSIRDII